MSEGNVDVTEVAGINNISNLQRKMKLKGTVTRIELYGAFVDIGLDAPAILHISQLPERVNRVSDVLSVDEEITVWVDKVDTARNQVTVTMQQPLAVEWSDLAEGQVYEGKVVRLENFGAFVDIGAEKEGLVHVSELSHDYVKHPAEVIKAGDEVQVKVLGFSRKKRRINLSIKALQEKPEAELGQLSMNEIDYQVEEIEEEMPTAMEMALRMAMGDAGVNVSSKQTRKRKKDRKAARRAQQEEIIMRTLELASQSND